MRGFCGIGIYQGKTKENLGTLWRSAAILGADFIFTIARRYQKQGSDTMKTWRHIPLWHFDTFEAFHAAMPYDCRLVGVELDARAKMLPKFMHPERVVYMLGAEDNGIPAAARRRCWQIVQLPGDHCLNVATAGSIVLYDRAVKQAA